VLSIAEEVYWETIATTDYYFAQRIRMGQDGATHHYMTNNNNINNNNPTETTPCGMNRPQSVILSTEPSSTQCVFVNSGGIGNNIEGTSLNIKGDF
jgi:hypothetical protein